MLKEIVRWEVLFKTLLKRDLRKALIWILGLGLFTGGFVPAFEEIGSGQGLIGMYQTMLNPAMIAMVGPTPIQSATEYTLGAMYAQEMLLFCGLFAMIIQALHIISHSRKDEELGFTELIQSYQVGRLSNSFALFIEAIVINGLLALVIASTMIVFQVESIDAYGSFLFALTVMMAGLIGAVIALVMAQINETSTGAIGMSMGIIGLMYLVRGATDVSNLSLSMLNPMGWIYLTYPFTTNNYLPIIYSFVFILATLVLSFSLESNRDMNAGYLPAYEGRANAKKSLLSVPGLFYRLNKGMLLAWLITYFILGASYGSIYGDMQTFLESNELIAAMFTYSGVSIEASFTSVIIMVMLGTVAILPIAIINKLFVQEERMHLSQLYASKLTYQSVFLTNLTIAILASVLGVLLSAIGLGYTAIYMMEGKSSMLIMDFIKAGFNFLPAILFFLGLSAMSIGYYPKARNAIYIYLAYSFALNYFGGLLDLPEFISKTAIFSWIPRMPIKEFDLTVFVSIFVLSLLMMVAGYFGYIKRDRIEGS